MRSMGSKRTIRIICTAIILFLALGSIVYTIGFTNGKNSAEAEINPVMLSKTITLTDETLEYTHSDTLLFGQMQAGEVLTQRIRLENRSSEPIVITEHHTSCGCTSADYERRPIEVGGHSDITVSYDSQGEWGWRMQRLEFYFAKKEHPLKIYIDAEIY